MILVFRQKRVTFNFDGELPKNKTKSVPDLRNRGRSFNQYAKQQLNQNLNSQNQEISQNREVGQTCQNNQSFPSQVRGRSLTRKYQGPTKMTVTEVSEIDRSRPPSVRDIAAKFQGSTDPRKFTENLRRAPAQSYMRKFQSESDRSRKTSDRSQKYVNARSKIQAQHAKNGVDGVFHAQNGTFQIQNGRVRDHPGQNINPNAPEFNQNVSYESFNREASGLRPNSPPIASKPVYIAPPMKPPVATVSPMKPTPPKIAKKPQSPIKPSSDNPFRQSVSPLPPKIPPNIRTDLKTIQRS